MAQTRRTNLRGIAACLSSKHTLMFAIFCFALFQAAVASKTGMQGSKAEPKKRAKASAKAPSSSKSPSTGSAPSPSTGTNSPVSSKSPSPAPTVKTPLAAVSTPSTPTRISSSKIGQPAKPVVWNQASTPGTSGGNRYGVGSTLPWFLLLGGGVGLASMASMTSCSSGSYLYSNRCRSNTHVRCRLFSNLG